MNIQQIRYFLEVARCESFSDAAKRLYITQPTLNRQITGIESELNMQLFFRSQKGVKLTPGGVVVYEELQKTLDTFETGIQKAEKVSQGYSGKIKIGIVSGLNVSEKLRGLLEYFAEKYPNIQIVIQPYSFRDLLRGLYQQELDIIISYDFHLDSRKDIETYDYMEYHPAWAIPLINPLSEKTEITFQDMKEEELVIVKEEDCPDGVQLIVDLCEQYGGYYPRFHFVDNMDSVYLWLTCSKKCAIINRECYLTQSESVRFYDYLPKNQRTMIKAGWLGGNPNPSLGLALNYMRDY